MLSYERRGPDGAPVVVCLHAGGVSRCIWDSVVERMPDLQAILIDLPGYRESRSLPRTSIDWATAQVAVVVACEAAGEPLNAMGLSLGAYVRVTLLARHPVRSEAAVLSDMHGGGMPRRWAYNGADVGDGVDGAVAVGGAGHCTDDAAGGLSHGGVRGRCGAIDDGDLPPVRSRGHRFRVSGARQKAQRPGLVPCQRPREWAESQVIAAFCRGRTACDSRGRAGARPWLARPGPGAFRRDGPRPSAGDNTAVPAADRRAGPLMRREACRPY